MNDFDFDISPEPDLTRPSAADPPPIRPKPSRATDETVALRLDLPPVFLLGLFASFTAAIILATALAVIAEAELLAAVALGTMGGHTGVTIVVATLHRGPVWVRWLFGSLAVGSVPCCVAIGLMVGDESFAAKVIMRNFFELFAPLPGLLLIAQFPVWAASLLYGAQRRRSGTAIGDIASSGGRFRIRDVMGVTTIVAVALALAKAGAWGEPPEELMLMTAILGGVAFASSLLLVVPCTIAALWSRNPIAGGLWLLGYTMIALTILSVVLCMGFRARPEEAVMLSGALFVTATTLYAVLLLIRGSRQRTSRESDHSEQLLDVPGTVQNTKHLNASLDELVKDQVIADDETS